MKLAMKSILGKSIAVVLPLLLVAQTSFADGKRLSVGGISITGGGMALVGTISTLSLEDKHPSFTYIGWTLIVLGVLIDGGDLAKAAETTASVSGAEVWSAMVKESTVLARHPSLIQSDSAIASAAQTLNLPPAQVAQMVVDLNAKMSANDVQAKYYPAGITAATQKAAVANLVSLSRMG